MQSFPPTSADTYKALARTWAATVTVVTTRRMEAAPSERVSVGDTPTPPDPDPRAARLGPPQHPCLAQWATPGNPRLRGR